MSAYAEHQPAPGLRDIVRCLWTFDDPVGDREPQRVAPDGCPELIVHLGSPYAEDGAPQPLILFAGQTTRPLTLASTGPVSVLGVRFQPDGARAFWGRSLADATDRRIDLASAHGAAARAFRSALIQAAPALRLAHAQAYVGARGRLIDADVRAAVAALTSGQEPPHSELSERTLQRRFAAHVGVSPRMLGSVFRFRRVFDAIENPATPGWVETALAAGYFDQPQMARDFRRFVGCTALEWARRQSGLARAIALSQSYKPQTSR